MANTHDMRQHIALGHVETEWIRYNSYSSTMLKSVSTQIFANSRSIKSRLHREGTSTFLTSTIHDYIPYITKCLATKKHNNTPEN